MGLLLKLELEELGKIELDSLGGTRGLARESEVLEEGFLVFVAKNEFLITVDDRFDEPVGLALALGNSSSNGVRDK